jgi:tetratricopeptide (TPR) repeat protein
VGKRGCPKDYGFNEMKRRDRGFCEKQIVVSFLLIIFLVPLIFLVPVNSVDLVKTGTMKLLLSVILILWFYKVFKEREYFWVKSPINLPVILFLWIAVFATIFSLHRYISLIGTYNRYQGLLTICCYILLFFITQILVKRKRDALFWTLDVVLFSNLFAMGYGFIQRAGLDPYQWSGGAWTRVHSTFGNPVFYAAWLSMVLPIALSMYLVEDRKRRRLWYATSFLLAYLSLLFANTRATFVGYFFASFFFSLLTVGFRFSFIYYGSVSLLFGIFSIFVIFSLSPQNLSVLALGGLFVGLLFFGPLIGKIRERRKEIGTIIALGILVTIACNADPRTSTVRRFYTAIASKMPKERRELPKIDAVKEAEDKVAKVFAESAKVRVLMWKACAKIVRDYPIFGIGPDTLGMVYPRYRDVTYVRAFSEHLGTNRAHNEILDMAISFGIPGLVVYYTIFSLLFVTTIKRLSNFSQKERFIITGLLCLQIAYIVQNQFSFGATTITSLSWVALGLVAGICGNQERVAVKKKASYLVGVTSVGTSLILSALLIPAFVADIHFRTGRVYQESDYPNIACEYYEKAIRWNPWETSYYSPLIRIYLVSGKRERIDRAIYLIQQALMYGEPSASLWHSLGTGYYLKGGKDAAEKALIAYRKAIDMDPLYGPSYHYIGVIYKDEGRLEEAKECLEKAVNLRPANCEFLETLGHLYMDLAMEEKARACWERIIKIDPKYSNIKDVRTRLSLIYFNKKMLDECAEQCRKILEIDPDDIGTRKNLATIYYEKRDWQKAAEECITILQKDPDNVYARQMLSAMGMKVRL